MKKTFDTMMGPPPLWILDAVKEKFGVEYAGGIIFTYGENIHTPKGYIPWDLYIHERTHIRQQRKTGVIEWWEKYLDDEEFRYSQEIEAYRNQYRWAKQNLNRQEAFKILVDSAKCLSGEMYGSLVNNQQAVRDIQKG